MNSETIQRKVTNQNIFVYEAHCSDKWSQLYRQKFWFKDLFRNINLKNKNVLEAMCGTGQVTEHLMSIGACVTGLDISDKAIERYRKRWPKAKAKRASILKSNLKANSFDCVVSIAGLHHLHPHLNQGIKEIYRILKPGGYFCFVEPHSGSMADILRKKWYKHDNFFAPNENSVDIEIMKKNFMKFFNFIKEKYGGGLAYILIPNSFAFRMPSILKSIYSPVLIFFENVFRPLFSKKNSCYVICQWQKIK